MSKKQQTLFQSWNNGANSKSLVGVKSSLAQEVTLDSDEDDELLRQALEESLRDYTNPQRNVPSPALSSSSGYSSGVPSGVAVENLPGFDSEAGKTWIYPTNKPIRKYQRDIVETSLFHNTLVTLPTGLGKTFIAAVVMYNFFRWYPRGKIIFMAPTKPLVAQQIQACYEIMGIPLECTSELTGAMNPVERKRHWQEKRVFYLTPQVLTNDISRSTCPATEVKCLVLDEAHKATGNHPYVQVVQELSKHGAVFRILALSATPGSDLKAIQQVIANLQISKIELRNEESADIVPYVHNRNIDKVIVPLGPEITQVRDQFLTILSGFARRLMSMNLLFTKDIGSLTKGMVITSRERFRQNPPGNLQRHQVGMAEGDFAMCITLTHALELLLQHGIRGFYNFLAGKTDMAEAAGSNRTRTELLKVEGFSRMMEGLKSKFSLGSNTTNAPVSHPKLTKLREIVLEHFKRAEAENRPTRVMIFSQFRDSVYEIVSLFDEHAPLIKAMSFVGHGKGTNGGKTKSFTQADQIRVIKQFTEGCYNTLVSTCVGEEGLDIGDVDMIICYDVHKSPVRLVQRMGRTGRKRDGRIVMLMTEGKEEHVFNQSMYQKKNLHKNMISSDKLKDFLVANGPRVIPRHLHPRCHEMPMQVVEVFPVPNARPAKAGTSSSTAQRKATKTTKCYYLSDAEAEYWTQNFATSERLPILPDSGRVKENVAQPLLKLDKWLPWQCSLQPQLHTGHSSLTHNYVDIMAIIQSQQEEWYDDHYHQPMTSFRDPPETEAALFLEEVNDLPIPLEFGSPEKEMAGCRLYSPEFLNLFNAVPSRCDSPDVLSPPTSPFLLSPDSVVLSNQPDDSPSRLSRHESPLSRNRDQVPPSMSGSPLHRPLLSDSSASRSAIRNGERTKNVVTTNVNLLEACNFDMSVDLSDEVSIVPQTPPQPAPLGSAEKECFLSSPILSQRARKPSVKRKLDASAGSTSPTVAAGKRVKLEAASIEKPLSPGSTLSKTSALAPSDQENERHSDRSHDTHPPTELACTNSADIEESILSITQVIEYVSTSPAVNRGKQEVVQPNFDLDVDLLFDDAHSQFDEERRISCPSTSPNTVQPTVPPVPESPVFDFTDRPSPSPTQLPPLLPSTVKADFSLTFPDMSDDDGEVEAVVKTSMTPCVAVVAQAEFSLGLPDFSDPEENADCETVPTPSPMAEPSKESRPAEATDLKSAWDDGFVLDWDDIEELDALENAVPRDPSKKTSLDDGTVVVDMQHKLNTNRFSSSFGENARLPPPTRSGTPPPAPGSDSSRIRREIEDIFGPEEDSIRSASPTTKKESAPTVVVLSDSDDEEVLAATPPPRTYPSRGGPADQTSDQDSPMVGCRRLNPKRNPLLTQSTPVTQKRAAGRPEVTKRAGNGASRRRKKAGECSFIEYEADLSSVDGVSCSEDEVDDNEEDNADRYEGSFVDDQATQHITDTMRAVYLRSVRSPLASKGFVFRPPARHMNRSEIFSQAVVEQDSDYMLDSFCVDNDEEELEEESSAMLPEEDVLSPVCLPPGRRTRRGGLVRQDAKTNGRARKRIIIQPDSSDSDAASPVKKPSPSILEVSSVPTAASTSGTSSFSQSREERLEKQRVKKEEFRRTMATGAASTSVPSSDRFVVPSAIASNAATSRVLISSRQVSTAGQIISSLQVKHKCQTHVCSFPVADFVVSPQLGVLRKLHSDFTNGSNRCRLQEQIRRLVWLYDKPYLIVEADRVASRDARFKGDPSPVPDASSIIFKTNSPYFLQTLAGLAQTEVSVLHSESQEHTARLLNDLGRQESLRGFTLPETGKLSTKQDGIVMFLQRISEINPAVAFLMATSFKTLREILNSSAEVIAQRCKISPAKARNIVHVFRSNHQNHRVHPAQ